MKAKTYWKFLTYHSYFIIQNKIVVSLNSSLQHWFPTCQGNNEQRTVPRLWESFSCSLSVFSFMHQRRQCQPTPVLLPGKSHGQRSLVGCSPWGLEESDMAEWLHFHFSLSCIGEGNGNSLQCSCLKNPRDRRPWLAAVYGVVQSRTQLKPLSSLSSSKVSY